MVRSVLVTTAWFDDVYLEDEQRQVLAWMVEAERSLPQANHGSFLLADTQAAVFSYTRLSLRVRRSARATLMRWLTTGCSGAAGATQATPCMTSHPKGAGTTRK